MLADRPVFLCGLPRSGTTLLHSLLDGHPQLLVSPSETAFFQKFVPNFADGMNAAERSLLQAFDPENNYYQLYLSHIDCDEMWAAMARQVGEDAPSWLWAMMSAWAQLNGQNLESVARWIEKTPFNELHREQIFAWWPDAKCIHLLRDPRAVLATYQKRQPGTTVEQVAFQWLRSATSIDSGRAENALPHQTLILTYEALVREPQLTMQQITDFLEIEWHETLLRPTKAHGKHDWRGNSAHNQKFSGIEAASAERWRTQLSEADCALIEQLLATSMHRFGFHSEQKRSTLWRTWPIHARWRIRRLAARKLR